MRKVVKKGAQKTYTYRVKKVDLATFNDQAVHPVCSTFALAREIEWATRQYVLEMIGEDEEGIGTHLSIDHRAPALAGEILEINSEVEHFEDRELICKYEVRVDGRLIAEGKTGQKILPKSKIDEIFSTLKNGKRQ